MQIPATTVEFLDAIKARKGLTSDYQLFKALGWGQTTISKYRVGGRVMSGSHAIRAADELGLPRAYVLACMEAEREHNEEVAGVWKEVANRFRGAAAIILIALAGLTAGQDAQAAQGLRAVPVTSNISSPVIYYAKSAWRWLAGWFRTEFPALVPA